MIPTTLALGLAATAIIIGWYFYSAAASSTADFYLKLGELALQVAIVVIVGTIAKSPIDWGVSQHSRQIEMQEARKEFMRRIRDIHVTIANARDLTNAHLSAKTWAEQSRRLMTLRPEVEDLAEDVRVSHNLFKDKNSIVNGIEGIATYLEKGGNEYIESHEVVEHGHRNNHELEKTIEKNNMIWVRDFMDAGELYKYEYESNLKKSKGTMRIEVYGI